MDKRKQEFLARLRETFRIEAAEHLETIGAGMLAHERASAEERVAIIERASREIHSLKGAARSVSLDRVERMCQRLESVLAAVKGGEMALSRRVLDVIEPTLALLTTACLQPGEAPSAEGLAAERRAIVELDRLLHGGRPLSEAPPTSNRGLSDPRADGAATQAAASTAPPPAPPPAPAPASPTPPRADLSAATTVRALTTDTVRVSAARLVDLLLDAEELVGAKLAAQAAADELRHLAADMAARSRRRARSARRPSTPERAAQEDERLREDAAWLDSLERKARGLAAAARTDAATLAGISDRLLDGARQALMLPCSSLLGSLPLVVADLARALGKDVGLSVHGEDIEIDRRILDGLRDPLVHLLRNSVDHGIEPPEVRRARGKPDRGSITLTLRPVEERRVELTVSDDGAGIDTARVRADAARRGIVSADEAQQLTDAEAATLVFHSGLSTSPIITEVSGRGLGLAIVREKVEALGGTVEVSSTTRTGTTFRLCVPMSLVTFRGVFVVAAGQRFVVPTSAVVSVTRIAAASIKTIENRQTCSLGGRAASVVRLRDVLGLPGVAEDDDAPCPAVVLATGDRRVAFLVDSVEGEQEVMFRSLGPQLPRVRNVVGASIQASGVVPILHTGDLVDSAITLGVPARPGSGAQQARARRRLMIAEDSITARTLLRGILESAGYDVIATVDGMDAWTRLQTEPVDLMVSDVDMPRLNGFELTARIRGDTRLADLPVVLVTALGSAKDREYGVEVGATAYIVKSDFDQSDLLQIIRRLL